MNRKKNLKQNLLICLLAGSAVMYTLPLHAATNVIANGTLPQNGQFVGGDAAGSIVQNGDLQLNVSQNYQNAVIKWDSFDIGGSATVNFSAAEAYANNFNTLNYVNSGAASQIYGTINAQGGNIFIVNPAGVQIGNSAQINVGSLYVSNKYLDESQLGSFAGAITQEMIDTGKTPDAALMSLGNINANKVTFEGDGCIVIDSERLLNAGGNAPMGSENINIKTNADNTGNIVIGYDAYDATTNADGSVVGYADKNNGEAIATVTTEDGTSQFTKANGYMWVEDVDQLQAINTNLGGNYALKNSIDATGTINWDDGGFKSIGIDNDGNVVETTVGEETKKGFYGKFDGLDYGIFDLNINRSGEDNVGLFGYASGATISNVTLVGGNISGSNNVGSVVGTAIDTSINNVVNAASVNGTTDVGGIVGSAQSSTINNLINTGKVMGTQDNIGGLVGYIANNSSLDGNSYNLGDISTTGYNVGGIAGYAVNSTLGGENDNNVLRNYMNISGAYNVGGIVGYMEGSTVQNAENSGDVVATQRYEESYYYHTANDNVTFGNSNNGLVTANVYVANVGGIAGNSSGGSTIQNVANNGDVSSAVEEYTDNNNHNNDYSYYTAGNVGGVVGKAVDTNITDAVNHDNNVRGAHNVGGIAGYFGSTAADGSTQTKYTISSSENLDGDIMATGARNNWSETNYTVNQKWHGFVTEIVRDDTNNVEEFIIGNIGGIAGYMDGDNVYISSSTNDGTVHTAYPTDPTNVKLAEQAANVGGIVGKIDRSQTIGIDNGSVNIGSLFGENADPVNAAVSTSFNNGDVRGYTGVGGIAGMMYNGELAAVYNQGSISSTRQVDNTGGNNIDPLNMGGIVGDTTEGTNAQVLLYDAYNEGDIGDASFVYNGRHVGGVVGRLSGYIEKAYNKGNIYNNDTTVGGIVGWWYNGKINNVFNTGNITARAKTELQVGGIVGASSQQSGLTLSNAYNLGTIRGYQEATDDDNAIYVGGIIGRVRSGSQTNISNVYTTGNLYAAKGTFNSDAENYGYTSVGAGGGLGAIYGTGPADDHVPTIDYANYIMPETDNFVNLGDIGGQQDYTVIEYNDRDDGDKYTFSSSIENPNITDGYVNENEDWRIYDGTTPILNAFLPYAEDYFEGKVLTDYGIGSIQYGTAYDPTLTIITANGAETLTFDWQELGIKNLSGLAVYGAGLTINNFVIDRGNNHFYGRIYADGDLVVNANALGDTNSNNAISLGYRSQLYGSSVTLNSNGLIEIRGDVTATGKKSGDVTAADNKNGSVYINAGEVQNYGVISSAVDGQNVAIVGITDKEHSVAETEDIANPFAEMVSAGDRYTYTTTAAKGNGDVNLTAEADKNGSGSSGNVGSYVGNKGIGYISAGGNLNVEADNDTYIDSDLLVNGDINLVTGSADGEIVLDLSNLGQVRKNAYVDAVEYAIRKLGVDINNPQQIYNNRTNVIDAIEETITNYNPTGTNNGVVAEHIYRVLTGLAEGDPIDTTGPKVSDSQLAELEASLASAYMHIFMHEFDKNDANADTINFAQKVVDKDGKVTYQQANDIKLAADMWDYENGVYDFTKYDSMEHVEGQQGLQPHIFEDELNWLKLTNGLPSYAETGQGNAADVDASEIMHVWVSDADQLQGIQGYYNQAKNETETVNGVEVNKGTEFLSYNFALKDDINANWVTGWEAIGTGSDDGFTGTFDGRGNRIIGLDATNGNNTQNIQNAGIFSTIGSSGTVENLNIYSSTFTGTTNAGAVAGINNGTIENIVALGNRVEVTGNGANADTAANAGGIVGVNNSGKVEAITENDEITYQITGGGINNVEVTGSVIAGSEVVAGGLIGTNNGGLLNSYSNSAVVGANNSDSRAGLGGVVGVNNANGTVGLVDSLGITNGGDELYLHVGGVIGYNLGKLSSAYNESIVSGRNQVGGIIGLNDAGGVVTDIVNAGSVTGWDFSNDERSYNVGGLIGTNGGSVTNGRNNGTITGTENVGGMVGTNQAGATLTNLVNDSSANITGEQYVGGIAGSNAGEISATDSNLINRGSITGNKFVGGVAGTNSGTITNTISSIVLNVKDPELIDDGDDNNNPSYFGGVVGQNSGTIIGATNQSTVDVAADGATYVGGIIGQNTSSGELQGQIRNEGTVSGLSNVGGIIGENLNASILNNEDNNVRLQITNTGNVSATEGGAAGIFYNNNITITGSEGETNANAINNADITNSGTVTGGTGTDSITGGLFGINSGNITNSTLTNTGVVTGGGIVGGLIGENTGDATGSTFTNEGIAAGNSNVGGLFGTNSGDFSTSSLINTVDAQVIGTNNVGGLIGTNTGTITGGRTEAAGTDIGYYKYQIYNNGIINVGTWNDTDNDSVVDNGEITLGVNGTNIGGLIGSNTTENGKTGSLTAGYNTGAINAGGSTNVGGIAGSNSGNIDQVFNTVMTADGQNQAITGGTNVGGLVGTNSGTLSNAYNTTAVVGTLDNAIVGNAVGENAGNAKVEFVYDVTNTDNKLIGNNSGSVTGSYALQGSGEVENANGEITYILSDEVQNKNSYGNFADSTWKFYDGQQTPLLNVFLTKVSVNQDKVNQYMSANKVYNGTMQQLTAADIKNLIESGAIYVDGLTKEEAFKAFNNNNSLISSIGYKDVGEHSNWLYSGQIASGSQDGTFNPNNLGYDIELTASLAQKQLSISDILANIVYGGNTYTDISGGSLQGIVNNDDVYLLDKDGNKISITSDFIASYLSGEYADNKDNRNTADVKRDQNNNVIAYENAIFVGGISLGGQLSGNYILADSTIDGDITVTPSNLTITLNDIYRIYGDHNTLYSNYEATQNGNYGIKDVIGLVNGDQNSLGNLIVTAISDGALDNFANPTKTNDVKDDGYKWSGNFSGISNVNSNYKITVNGGNSIVKAKTITIKDLLGSIVYGNQSNKGLQINTGASLADGSIVYGDYVTLVGNANYTTGGVYEDNRGNRTTADVGEYTDSLFVRGLSLSGDKAGNYVLDTDAAVGNIEVTKANLTINVGNAETVYGDAFKDSDYTHTLSGVTNGDSDSVIDELLGGNYFNNVAVGTGKDTANAGNYNDALGFVNYQELKNYDVQVENGDVIINKKDITITAGDQNIVLGQRPNYANGSTVIEDVLVNGDQQKLPYYEHGISDTTLESVVGTHTDKIGVWLNGTFYDLSQNPEWHKINGLEFFANYNITFNPGTLTVSEFEVPQDWPHNRWDYLFGDNPFDRNENFRERKAEVNFVDGGMEI